MKMRDNIAKNGKCRKFCYGQPNEQPQHSAVTQSFIGQLQSSTSGTYSTAPAVVIQADSAADGSSRDVIAQAFSMMDMSTELGDQSFSSLLNQMSPSCPMPKWPVDAETDIVNLLMKINLLCRLVIWVQLFMKEEVMHMQQSGRVCYGKKKVVKCKRSTKELNNYLRSRLVGTGEIQIAIDDGELYTSVDNM